MKRCFAIRARIGTIAVMFGPQILVDTLSVPGTKTGWQYHSRGDRHSKAACWGILLDVMAHCPTLVAQIEAGQVAFGINHEMRDFQQNRKKNLDLVICTPGTATRKRRTTFAAMAEKHGLVLNPTARRLLAKLPVLPEAPVGFVRVALEAKAAMTAHVKALSRLHDELNSSHLTIHGAAAEALAVGFVMVNASPKFISPGLNKDFVAGARPKVSSHTQPDDAIRVIDKVREIPRRARMTDQGFDALGIVLVDCLNDGKAPVELVTAKPAPQPNDIFHYDQMVRRIAELYKSRFA